MATSIGKLSKSFFLKLLVGIIILPFVFWGMGDVFRGGNQNVVATVDSNKISTQEFVNYINRLNLNEEQVKNLSKTDLVEQILSDYIGKKVMSLEIEKLGVVVSDNALRDIIKNDKVRLSIYNVKGEMVRTLVNSYLDPGSYEVRWNGRSDSGVNLSAGMYFIELKGTNFRETNKMIYLK